MPIFRSFRDYVYKNADCQRVQFPLVIAYAITVHKSQASTLEKVVLDIGTKEFVSGLTYVALSRVKSLAGLMFDGPFGLEAVCSPPKKSAIDRSRDWDFRSAQIIRTPSPG